MNARRRMLVTASACIWLATTAQSQQAAQNVPARLEVTVDPSHASPAVSKYQYGMFTEHIRNSLSRSLWAELIDDRKFYFPIVAADPKSAAPAAGFGGRDAALHKWVPVGPTQAVVMDKSEPFVGEQSPRIDLDASVPHGIRQSGMLLVKGKSYKGRVVLRGAPGAHVSVALVWAAVQRTGKPCRLRPCDPLTRLSLSASRHQPMPPTRHWRLPVPAPARFTLAPSR